jgi:hypothetical protein
MHFVGLIDAEREWWLLEARRVAGKEKWGKVDQ